MAFTRAFRSLLVRLMVGALLLSQFAIVGYACPRPVNAQAVAHQAEAAQGPGGSSVSHCARMDATQKSLCAEHCHPSTQSADTASPPAPSAAMAIVLYAVPALALADVHAAAASRQPANAPSLDVAASPPHAIAHCVWRI